MPGMVFSAAVEGPLDEAILRKIMEMTGNSLGPVYGKQGKGHLKNKIRGYNAAAGISPWIVLVDLNQENSCAPALVKSWLPNPEPNMHLRVAVRKIESWLFADREIFARYFRLSIDGIPRNPDDLPDPKRLILDLLSHSRSKEIRNEMLPARSSGRKVGPGYSYRLVHFVDTSWRPVIASRNSPSLYSCIKSVSRISYGQS